MDGIGQSARLMLRPLTPADATLIQPLADNWEVAKQTGNLPHPYGPAEAGNFVTQALAAHKAGREQVFAIVRRQDDALIGLIGLVMDVAPMEVGYWLGQPFWGRGYASEALSILQDYVRTDLYGATLDAIVFDDNMASIRILIKCGFEMLESWREDFPQRGGMRTLVRFQWRVA